MFLKLHQLLYYTQLGKNPAMLQQIQCHSCLRLGPCPLMSENERGSNSARWGAAV